MDLRQPLALISAAEADGASRHGGAVADGLVKIPMPGGSEIVECRRCRQHLNF